MAGVTAESLLNELREIRQEMQERDERHARELLQLRQKVDRLQGFVHSMHLAGMVQSQDGNLYFKASVGSDSIVQQHNVHQLQRRADVGGGGAQPSGEVAQKSAAPTQAMTAAAAAAAAPGAASEKQQRQREWIEQQKANQKAEADAKAAQSLPRVPEPWKMRAPKSRSFIGQSFAESQKAQQDEQQRLLQAQQKAMSERRAQQAQQEAERLAQEEEARRQEDARLAAQEAEVQEREEKERIKRAQLDASKQKAFSTLMDSGGGDSSSGMFEDDVESPAMATAATAGAAAAPTDTVDSSLFSLDDDASKSF